ncbi:hypothetical protein Dimus_038716 [Dionaea muscipula]
MALVATSDLTPQVPFAGIRRSSNHRPNSHITNHQGSQANSCGRWQPTRGKGQRAAPTTGDSSSVYFYKCGYPNHKANVCEATTSAGNTAQAFTVAHVSDQVDSYWYPDTGASHHMTPDPSLSDGMQPYTGTDSIIVGNGCGLPITSTGNVHITPTVTLEKVLIVLQIQKNLLSVSKFIEENSCYFIFYP